jgi:dsRNA-specific ribonuclease
LAKQKRLDTPHSLREEYRYQVEELDVKGIENVLGYTFQDKKHLILALTHSSISPKRNNERMEFRGDKILAFLMSEIIEQQMPEYSPRDRTDLYSSMTNNALLRDKIAKDWGLTNFMLCAPNTHLTGKPISDCVEAIICAIYDDGGIEEAGKFLVQHWKQHLMRNVQEDGLQVTLSTYFNQHSLGKPKFEQLKKKNSSDVFLKLRIPAHNGMDSGVSVTGHGRSPRRARNHAALLALRQLGIPVNKPESPAA